MANLLIGLVGINHIGRLNLICCAVLMYALGRMHGKVEALKKERLLHE